MPIQLTFFTRAYNVFWSNPPSFPSPQTPSILILSLFSLNAMHSFKANEFI